MEIIKMDARTQNDKRMQYKLTKSPHVEKMQDSTDQVIKVVGFVFYTDTDKSAGTDKMILTVMEDSGRVLGTNSQTAQENFMDILEFFEEDLQQEGGTIPVRITANTSKNKRTFIMLEYAG